MYGIIYRACLNDGRSYVGQTTQTLDFRKRIHKTKSKNEKENTHFYLAVRKYGFDAFEWEILQECETKEELDNAEKFWIIKLNSLNDGFNLKTGGSYGKHSEETKKKFSENKKGKKNPRYGKESPLKGKKLPWAEKIPSKFKQGHSTWNKGLPKEKQPAFGRIKTQEEKNKISKANGGESNGMSTMTTQIVKNIREDYKTGRFLQKDLAIKYGISNYQVWSVVNNKRWKK